jgi:hypothetical protein
LHAEDKAAHHQLQIAAEQQKSIDAKQQQHGKQHDNNAGKQMAQHKADAATASSFVAPWDPEAAKSRLARSGRVVALQVLLLLLDINCILAARCRSMQPCCKCMRVTSFAPVAVPVQGTSRLQRM